MNKKAKMNLVDAWFRTENGQYVIGQWPNWLVYAAFAVAMARIFLWQDTGWAYWLRLLESSVWFYWAYLEYFSGVNRFRRVLGLVVGTVSLGAIVRTIFFGLN